MYFSLSSPFMTSSPFHFQMSNHEDVPREDNRMSPSNSSHHSSTRPSPHQRKLKEVMNPSWLRAHNPQKHISNSDTNSPLVVLADDLESVYKAGEEDDAVDRTNDLLNYFNQNEVGLSRLGRGRWKDINLIPGRRDIWMTYSRRTRMS